MEYMLCRNRVTDFAKWKSIFDSHAEAHRAAGLRLVNLWRGIDEPRDVFFLFEVKDMAGARGFIDNPDAAEAGQDSGVVDGEWHFIESTPHY